MIVSSFSDADISQIRDNQVDDRVYECTHKVGDIGSCIILDNQSQNKQTFSIAIFSENPEDKYVKIEQPTFEKMINQTSERTRFLLGYSSDNINMEPIPDYKHRAFIVSQGVKSRYPDIATDLYLAHNKMRDHPREVTISPSLLSFYIKKGYQITTVYMPTANRDHEYVKGDKKSYYPAYDIDTQEKRDKIYSIIKVFLNNGDVWLPFFVGLEKTETIGEYNPAYMHEMERVFQIEITIGTILENEKRFLLDESGLDNMLQIIGIE